MLAGTFFRTGLGLGLGLEDSGHGLALGLGCCWTCYKSGQQCTVADLYVHLVEQLRRRRTEKLLSMLANLPASCIFQPLAFETQGAIHSSALVCMNAAGGRLQGRFVPWDLQSGVLPLDHVDTARRWSGIWSNLSTNTCLHVDFFILIVARRRRLPAGCIQPTAFRFTQQEKYMRLYFANHWQEEKHKRFQF